MKAAFSSADASEGPSKKSTMEEVEAEEEE
jgi:hypothetical protein